MNLTITNKKTTELIFFVLCPPVFVMLGIAFHVDNFYDSSPTALKHRFHFCDLINIALFILFVYFSIVVVKILCFPRCKGNLWQQIFWIIGITTLSIWIPASGLVIYRKVSVFLSVLWLLIQTIVVVNFFRDIQRYFVSSIERIQSTYGRRKAMPLYLCYSAISVTLILIVVGLLAISLYQRYSFGTPHSQYCYVRFWVSMTVLCLGVGAGFVSLLGTVRQGLLSVCSVFAYSCYLNWMWLELSSHTYTVTDTSCRPSSSFFSFFLYFTGDFTNTSSSASSSSASVNDSSFPTSLWFGVVPVITSLSSGLVTYCCLLYCVFAHTGPGPIATVIQEFRDSTCGGCCSDGLILHHSSSTASPDRLSVIMRRTRESRRRAQSSNNGSHGSMAILSSGTGLPCNNSQSRSRLTEADPLLLRTCDHGDGDGDGDVIVVAPNSDSDFTLSHVIHPETQTQTQMARDTDVERSHPETADSEGRRLLEAEFPMELALASCWLGLSMCPPDTTPCNGPDCTFALYSPLPLLLLISNILLWMYYFAVLLLSYTRRRRIGSQHPHPPPPQQHPQQRGFHR